MKKITALLVLLIGLLQYRLWFGDGNVLEFQRLNDRIADLRQEGAKRRERNAALEAEVMDLKQGLDAVEERARQDLGMIKEGEVFVQVIDDTRQDPDVLPAPQSEIPVTPPSKPEPAKKPKAEKTIKSRSREAGAASPDKTRAASAEKPTTVQTRKPSPQQPKPVKAAPKPKPSVESRPKKPPAPEKPTEKTDQ